MHRKDSDGENFCVYCKNGTPLYGGESVLCRKHGLMKPTATCRRFKYDPLKRKIKPMPPMPQLLPLSELE